MAINSRAYVDAPITDVAGATAAAGTAARRWRLPAPVLVRIGMNAIFVAGDEILRVSAPTVRATASIELAHFLTAHGLRVPRPAHDDIVEFDHLSVTGWERLTSTGADIDWRAVGSMVRVVHALDATSLPASVPLASPSRLPWWDFPALLRQTDGALDDAARRGIEATIGEHAGWATFDDQVVCHGDVHPGNVMMTPDGPTLIDWDLLSWAPAGWDHAPMLTWASRWGGSGDEYNSFATGYGRSLADDPAARAFAQLRLVAATLMRLVAGRTNPDAMLEAQLRLRYWRGENDAPAWTAQ